MNDNIRLRKYYVFYFLVLLLVIICNSTQALTFHGHTPDLDIYRFTQILDVSEEDKIDIWTLIQLRFNQNENRTNAYYIELDLYPIEDGIDVYPNVSPYKDYLRYEIEFENNSSIKFYLDEEVNKRYEYYTLAFKYQVKEEKVLKKVSQWEEPFERWNLNHYVSIPQSIGNYIRKCIILPKDVIVQDAQEHAKDESVPYGVKLESHLSYSWNKTEHRTIIIDELNSTIYKDATFLYKLELEEIETSLSISRYRTLELNYQIIGIFLICVTMTLIILNILCLKNYKIFKFEKFNRYLYCLIITSIITTVYYFYFYRDQKLVITLSIAFTSIILALVAIYFSCKFSKETGSLITDFKREMDTKNFHIEKLIENFREEQIKHNKEVDRRFDELARTELSPPRKITNNIMKYYSTEGKYLEDYKEKLTPIIRKEERSKLKMQSYELVETISNILEKQVEWVGSAFAYDGRRGVQVDFLIPLGMKEIPIQVKVYPKRIIMNNLPLRLAKTMNFIMEKARTEEAILIIMNPGIQENAKRAIIDECLPNTLHIVWGKTIDQVVNNLMDLIVSLEI